MDFSEQYHIEGESWYVKCDEKSISSKSISTMIKWHHYVTLENSAIMLIWRQLLDNIYYYMTSDNVFFW